MKAFGIRLAAGAVVIMLGAIMAAQAQKDHQERIDTAWNPDIKTPQNAPTPLAGAIDGLWATDQESEETSGGAMANPFPDTPGAVQLVQHNEEVADTGSTFALPDATTLVPDAAESAQMSMSDALQTMKDAASGAVKAAAEPITAPLDLPQPLGSAPQTETALSAVSALDNLPPLQDVVAPQENLSGPSPMAGMPQPSNALRGGPAMPEQLDMSQHMPTPLREEAAPAHQQLQHDARPEPMPMIRTVGVPEQAMGQAAPNPMLGNPPAMQPNQFAGNGQQPNQFMQTGGNMLPKLPPPAMNQNRTSLPAMVDNGAPAFHENAHSSAGTGQFQFDNRQPQQNNAQFNQVAPTFGHQDNQGPVARMASHAIGGGANYGPGGDGELAYAHPGDRRLEGAQTPSVVIHKSAPPEVKVGKPASFTIRVQNVGSAEASDVKVHDRVPVGMRLTDASPRPSVVGKDGQLVWQLGAMGAGQERTITMQLVPEKEGELGSVARVTFEAAASVRTMSTQPMLKIVQLAPKEVLIGQQLQIELEVSNPGTGAATGVMLQEDVPQGLEHPKGRQLDNLIGTLRPGEVRRQMLTMRATAPGIITNTIRLKGDDGLETSDSIKVQVVSPQLQVALSGPKLRFLEREAKFVLDIANAGTAAANNVEIAAYLDRGFRFMSTENEGRYVQSEHAVFWAVENLPVGARGQIPLVLLPVQEGARTISLEAKGDLGVVAKNEKQVSVNSLAELTFSINDSADPIEVGGETTYELRIQNSGSRPDSNVQVQIQFPPGVEVLSTDGDVMSAQRGLVAFQPRRTLAADGEIVYQIKTRGVQPGTHKIQAVVKSDQSQVAVTKEESTMVYADR